MFLEISAKSLNKCSRDFWLCWNILLLLTACNIKPVWSMQKRPFPPMQVKIAGSFGYLRRK
jgi:hypothetical protein